MFEEGLKTCCPRNEFRGYQEKSGEYIESAKNTVQNKYGVPVDVRYEKPTLY